jgi:hypothetical protein
MARGKTCFCEIPQPRADGFACMSCSGLLPEPTRYPPAVEELRQGHRWNAKGIADMRQALVLVEARVAYLEDEIRKIRG